MKTSFYTLIAALLILAACSKESKTTVVEGYAYEKNTTIPLEGVHVHLFGMGGALGLGSGGTHGTGTRITGSDGYYRFEFEHNGAYGIRADGLPPDYFDVGINSDIQNGTSNRIDMHLAPQAWLKVHIKNVNPHDFNDRVSMFIMGYPEDYYGTLIDRINIYRTPGNSNKILSWGVTKNGIFESNIDTIYIIGRDTTLYEIHY